MKRDSNSSAKKSRLFGKIAKGGLFRRYFAVFSAVIMASFFLIGVFLLVFTADYWGTTKLQLLSENAENLADTTSEAMRRSGNSERSAIVITNSIEQISRAIDADVFICNMAGDVIMCKDMLSPDYSVSQTGACLFHSSYHLSDKIINSVVDGYSGFETLDGLYARAHAVALEPIYIDNEMYGVVVATTPLMKDLTQFSLRMLYMFFLAGAMALLLSSVAVYAMADRFSKPLRQMAQATKMYAIGNFSYRVECKGNDELTRLIEDFNSMAEALAALESSRRSFVANVSHEFKTPMTTIGGFINGILDGTIPPEKQEYYLGIVSSEVNRLSRLVTTMLNISRIETGNVDLKFGDYDVSEAIFDTFCGFEGIISEKKIDVRGLDKIAPTIISADSDMFNQAIYNLVDNAVKFTDAGGVIGVAVTQNMSNTVIRITNTGKGIPQEDLSRVFERFYKVDKSRSTDVKSVGLGLHLVKSIIELHGGTIKASSVVNDFTEFTVTVPRTRSAAV